MRRRWTLRVESPDGFAVWENMPMRLFWTLKRAYRTAYILNTTYPAISGSFVPVRRFPRNTRRTRAVSL